jgi:hypothetical protein
MEDIAFSAVAEIPVCHNTAAAHHDSEVNNAITHMAGLEG